MGRDPVPGRRHGALRPLLADNDPRVAAAALAPDGRTLALLAGKYLECYDLSSGKRKLQIKHGLPMLDDFILGPTQLAFSPDGRKVLYADGRGSIAVRDSVTGQALAAPQREEVCPLLVQASDSRGLVLNSAWKEGRLDGRPLLLFGEGGRLQTASPVALSPDGRTLAVAHQENVIRLWDLKTGKQRLPRTTLRGLSWNWNLRADVRLSPDGRTVALLDDYGVLTVGESATGRVGWQVPDRGAIVCFAFSADGKQLIVAELHSEGRHRITFRETGSGRIQQVLPTLSKRVAFLTASPDRRWLAGSALAAQQVGFWDLAGHHLIWARENTPGSVWAGLFIPDKRLLLTVGEDGHFQSWDVARGRQVKRWSGHGGHRVNALDCSANGGLVASAGDDGMVSLWDPASGKHLRRIDCGERQLDFVALSPDGRLVAAIGRDGNLTGWETETGRPRFCLKGMRARVTAARFTPDGRRLVTALADGTALVWDTKMLLAVERVPAAPRLEAQEKDLPAGALLRVGSVSFQHPDSSAHVVLSSDGRQLIVHNVGSPKARADTWNVATGRRQAPLATTDWRVRSLTFSPDGKTVAAVVGLNDLHLFDRATGECRARINLEDNPAWSLAFSPDGRMLALGLANQGTSPPIRLWDVQQEKFVARLPGRGISVSQLAYSSDGRLLSGYSSGNGRYVWDVVQRKQIARFPLDEPLHGPQPFLVLSPQGHFVAQRDKANRFVVRDSLTDHQRFDLGGGIASLGFSGDDKVLAVARGSAELEVWDTARGEKRSRLRDPTVPAAQEVLSLSGDGRWLVTRDEKSETHVIHVWDLTTGKPHRPLAGLIGTVRAVTWRPDGKLLLLEQGGTVARLSDDSGQELLRWTGRPELIESLNLSADGRLAVLVDRAGAVEVWNVALGKKQVRGKLAAGSGTTSQVCFSADGKQVLALGPAGALGVWSVAGAALPCWQAGRGETALNLSLDGRLLAAVSQFKENEKEFTLIRLLDPLTGKEQCRFRSGPWTTVAGVAFSADSRLLGVIWVNDSTSKQWIGLVETATGQEMIRLAMPGESTKLSFSPDGRFLVARYRSRPYYSTTPEDCCLVYDLVLGRELGVLAGHSGKIQTLAFSPDGKRLATGSLDQTALVWDATWPTLPRRPMADTGQFNAEEPWLNLSRPEAEPAWRAVWRLALAPEQSLPLLRLRLPPAEVPDPRRLARLLRELEDDAFAKREAARKEIVTVGEAALPTLRHLLRGKPSAELKRQISGLLEEIEPRARQSRMLARQPGHRGAGTHRLGGSPAVAATAGRRRRRALPDRDGPRGAPAVETPPTRTQRRTIAMSRLMLAVLAAAGHGPVAAGRRRGFGPAPVPPDRSDPV